MEKYHAQIEEEFLSANDGEEKISKLEFIGSYVFGFTTYESHFCEILASKMIEVCEAIVYGLTFDYQNQSEEHYHNYLTMVNMPFLIDKIEWGTSIRGAWIVDYGDGEYTIGITSIVVKKKDIKYFLHEVINWYGRD